MIYRSLVQQIIQELLKSFHQSDSDVPCIINPKLSSNNSKKNQGLPTYSEAYNIVHLFVWQVMNLVRT